MVSVMFNRVQEVRTLPDFWLSVLFVNGESKKYNVQQLFHKWRAFEALASVEGLFEQVKVDIGGYGVSWNDEIDMSCNELYENGIIASDS